MTNATDTAGIGHNAPPSVLDEARALAADRALPHNETLTALKMRASQLPAKIENDEHAGTVQEFMKACVSAAKAADDTREIIKRPYLDATRAIDGPFKTVIDAMNALKEQRRGGLTRYLAEKEAAERRRRAELARIEQEEAARKLAEAEAARTQTQQDRALDAAAAHEQVASAAAAAAAAPKAELSRTRSTGGTVASLRTEWKGRITNRALIDFNALGPYFNDKAIQSALDAYVKAGLRDLSGTVIEEVSVAQVV